MYPCLIYVMSDIYFLFILGPWLLNVYQKCHKTQTACVLVLSKPGFWNVQGSHIFSSSWISNAVCIPFTKWAWMHYAIRAGHLKWIVVRILQAIVVMFETTGGLVKNLCLTVDTKFLGKWQKCPPKKLTFLFVNQMEWNFYSKCPTKF